jgi:hypothetical protein
VKTAALICTAVAFVAAWLEVHATGPPVKRVDLNFAKEYVALSEL